MSIQLSLEAKEMLRKQRSVFRFLNEIAEKKSEATIQDYYLGELLSNTDALEKLNARLSSLSKREPRNISYHLTYHLTENQTPKVSENQIQQSLRELDSVEIGEDSRLPESIADSNYEQFVGAMYDIVQKLQQIQDMPQLEEDDEQNYPDVEKKLAINHVDGAIVMSDINSQQKSTQEWSIIKSGFFRLYICIFFGASGLCFMTINLYMYAVQGLGGSALDSKLL